MNEFENKIDDTNIKLLAKDIQEFIDKKCKVYGFEVNEDESSISNGYNKAIDCQSIRFGVYFKKVRRLKN